LKERKEDIGCALGAIKPILFLLLYVNTVAGTMETLLRNHWSLRVKIIFTLISFLSFHINAITVSETLENIPLDDKNKLEKFFKVLISQYSFGYTLLDVKPMTTESWPVGFLPAYLPLKNSYLEEIEDGLNLLKKYEHLIPIKKFIFSDRYVITSDGLIYHEIYLINSKECRKIYLNFSTYFNGAPLPEEILLAHPSSQRSNIFQYHVLLGLLLGYGEQNSLLFQKKYDLTEKIQFLPLIPSNIPKILNKMDKDLLRMIKIGDFKPKSADYFDQESILKEYLALDKNWGPFSCLRKDNPLTPVALPQFMVDYHSSESELLYQRYSDCRKEISHILQSPLFLEKILNKLCEGD
jgi:hypothetical protein